MSLHSQTHNLNYSAMRTSTRYVIQQQQVKWEFYTVNTNVYSLHNMKSVGKNLVYIHLHMHIPHTIYYSCSIQSKNFYFSKLKLEASSI